MSTPSRMLFGGLVLFAAGWICGSLSRDEVKRMARIAATPGAYLSEVTPVATREEGNERQSPSARDSSSPTPAQIVASILALPPGQLRLAALKSAIGQLPKDDRFASARALLDALPPGALRSRALEILIPPWVHSDSAAAIAFARSLPTGSFRSDALGAVAFALAGSDPIAALDVAGGIPAKESREISLVNVAVEWSAADPAAAASNFLGRPDSENSRVLPLIVGEWCARDPAAALAWVRENSLGGKLDTLLMSCFSALGKDDPAVGAAFFETLDESTRKTVASSLASSWSEVDPAAAAAWVQHLPPGEAADEALTEVVEHWADQDPHGAARWIEQLPAGPRRDDLVASFTTHVMGQDPVGALAWARTLQNTALRTDVVVSLFRDWMRDDPDNASAAIRKTDLLDASTRAKLLEPAQ